MKRIIIVGILFILLVFCVISNAHDLKDDIRFEPEGCEKMFTVGSYENRYKVIVLNAETVHVMADELGLAVKKDMVLKTDDTVDSQIKVSLPIEQGGKIKFLTSLYFNPVTGNVKARPFVMCGGIK